MSYDLCSLYMHHSVQNNSSNHVWLETPKTYGRETKLVYARAYRC